MQNQEWAKCIKELLDRHDLSLRAAAIKAGRPNLRTYLADWINGQLPQYNTAVDFLRHYPLEEAAECLRAGGYPVPDEWRDEIEDEEIAFDMYLSSRSHLSEEFKAAFKEFAHEQLKKYGKKH